MGERLVLPPGVLQAAIERPDAARQAFGVEALMEAGKGLSRVLTLNDVEDIERFGKQLRKADAAVVAEDYVTAMDGIVVFALSYTQHNAKDGRFKFSDEQWTDLKQALLDLGRAGVQKIRLWYDQCLWLRDASQRSWAHIGVLPYTIWPVLSLGTKRSGAADRSLATFKRFWPFVEEVAGLWGGGVVFTRELRTPTSSKMDTRKWYSYNRRAELPPAETLRLVLLNIFHGAADDLRTGWQDDVVELQEMARWNVMYGERSPIIGPDWRNRLGADTPNDAMSTLRNVMTVAAGDETDSDDEDGSNPLVYLDDSRRVNFAGWSSVAMFLSGNPTVATTPSMRKWTCDKQRRRLCWRLTREASG